MEITYKQVCSCGELSDDKNISRAWEALKIISKPQLKRVWVCTK
jgi:hypothetical protein